jgi:hypothetical protein
VESALQPVFTVSVQLDYSIATLLVSVLDSTLDLPTSARLCGCLQRVHFLPQGLEHEPYNRHFARRLVCPGFYDEAVSALGTAAR